MGFSPLLAVLLLLTQTVFTASTCDKELTEITSSTCKETYGEKWLPSWSTQPRTDLRCKMNEFCTCKTLKKYEEYDNCCTCHSCAFWEGSETELYIEFVSILGKSLVFIDQASLNPDDVDKIHHNESEKMDNPSNICDKKSNMNGTFLPTPRLPLYKVNHTYDDMTEIPSNICNWDKEMQIGGEFVQDTDTLQHIWEKIVLVNFKHNRISKIENLNCLVLLNKLDMSHNRLTYLSNTSISNLKYLRIVDFSYNRIKRIDPGILTSDKLNLFETDFSHNNMSELDVSNMLSLYPFCHIDFEANQITKLVNEANFKLDTTKTYGPGFIHFKDNDLKEWPDFKQLFQLDEISQLGRLLNFAMDFRDIPIICDCHLAQFMSLADEIKAVLWTDFMKVKCSAPEKLKNIPINEVDEKDFICNLDAKSHCHTSCACTDKPNENVVTVDCSQDPENPLTKLPTLPVSQFSQGISLNFSHQKITNLTGLSTLSNITMLDVSNNDVKEITNDVAKALENATFVDLSNNKDLNHLPKMFLPYRNVCSTNMHNLLIHCDCDSLWLETWLHPKQCIDENYMFQCLLPNGEIKPGLLFTASDVDCSSSSDYIKEYLIGSITLFLIFTGFIIYTLRYELLILCVRIKQKCRNTSKSNYKYDLFLSYNDANESVNKWVDIELENDLVNAGYKVFQPRKDIPFGSERDAEVLTTIRNTRSFLIVFTDDYLDQTDDGMRSWTENEWKYCWHNFIRNSTQNIVLINFDHMSSFHVAHLQIKAFLRVGCTVDFKNQNRKIMEDIFKKLGKPSMPPIPNERIFENWNIRFLPQELFAAEQESDTEQDIEQARAGNDSESDTEQDIEQATAGNDSESDTEQDIEQAKAELPNISKFKIQKNSKNNQADEIVTLSSEIKIKHEMKKHQENQEKAIAMGNFAHFHEERFLKKTPHIPLFEKQQQKPKFKPQSDRQHTKSDKYYESIHIPLKNIIHTLTDDHQCDPEDLDIPNRVETGDESLHVYMVETEIVSQASLGTDGEKPDSGRSSVCSNQVTTGLASSRTSLETNVSTGSMPDVSY